MELTNLNAVFKSLYNDLTKFSLLYSLYIYIVYYIIELTNLVYYIVYIKELHLVELTILFHYIVHIIIYKVIVY